jgi:hypothetical protein
MRHQRRKRLLDWQRNKRKGLPVYGPREPRCPREIRDAMLCDISSYENDMTREQVDAWVLKYSRLSALRLLPKALVERRGPLCKHAALDNVLLRTRYCWSCPTDESGKPDRLWVWTVNPHLAAAYAAAMGY